MHGRVAANVNESQPWDGRVAANASEIAAMAWAQRGKCHRNRSLVHFAASTPDIAA
jgi:hypothetical protein